MIAIVTYEQMRDTANALVVVFYYGGSTLAIAVLGFLLYRLVKLIRTPMTVEWAQKAGVPFEVAKKRRAQLIWVFVGLWIFACCLAYKLLWGAWTIFMWQAGLKPIGM